MSLKLDADLKGRGTKFRLFPQPRFLKPFQEPETVWVSPRAGSVGPGPGDDRMYVVDAVGKEQPYEFPYLPPYDGPARPPVEPNQFGHFDHLEVGTREFEAAHMYGTLRRVLDIWEGYSGKRIDWHFEDRYDRLELIPFVDWDNAQSGYGFIETGYEETDEKAIRPFSLNFDVLAHELGHSIIFSQVGFPAEGTDTDEFFAFHEFAGDMLALVSVLHFDSVVDHLLRCCNGSLYTVNELNRIGELSQTDEIRVANNLMKMSDFRDGWTNVHHLAQPLTGAVFDILVDVFQQTLLEKGLISPELWSLAESVPEEPVDLDVIEEMFGDAYRGRHEDFKAALLDARDLIGTLLARTWGQISPSGLTFADVGDAFLAVDRDLTGGKYQSTILENFAWREIGAVPLGPKLESAEGHDHDAPTPETEKVQAPIPWKLSFRQKLEVARSGR
jgi:hypothetical protein